jgi:hypothetical protein
MSSITCRNASMLLVATTVVGVARRTETVTALGSLGGLSAAQRASAVN